MYIATELLGVVADLAITFLFLWGTFNTVGNNKVLTPICYACLGILLAIFSFIEDASFIRIAVYAVGIFTISVLCCNTKPLQALYAALALCALAMITDVLLFQLLTTFELDGNAIMSHSNARAVYVMVTHITWLLLIVLLLTITRRKRSAITIPFVLMLSPGCLVSILLGGMFCMQVQSSAEDVPFSFFLACVALLYMNLLLVFYAERMKESTDKQKEQELAQKHYEMQSQYYEALSREQDETRAMFHDINKYMLAMQALAAKDKSKESSEVLAQAQSLYHNIGNLIDVGNPVISAILSDYKQQLDAEQITLEYDVSIPSQLKLSAAEAYILLGNTLDNAIEACLQLPDAQRHVKLQMKQFHDILFYQIENPFADGYQRINKGKQHGYGLKSVENVVCNHKGVISKESTASIFCFTARMSA